ncbi:MAG TPA: helix-turn-helix domain-containing protein [Pseudonocardia sp.]|jgi:AcrR family transcriptional regulator
MAPVKHSPEAVPNTALDSTPSDSRRKLRRPEEVRALLLAAARDVFGSKGYDAASTTEIAKTAGVAHALLFRHFGTKAELFEQAVFEPFQAAIGQVLGRWSTYGHQPHSPSVSSADFVDQVYAFLRENSQLVTALAATPHYDERVHHDGGDPSLSRLLDTVSAALETEAKVHGWHGIDVPIAPRIAFCAVLGITVFDRWVFPRGDRHPSEDRIKAELAATLAQGLGGRPRPDEAPDAL